MSDWATLDGVRIISGTLAIPYWGTWAADFLLATPNDVPAQSTVVLGDLTLIGTTYRAASYSGARSERVVGGAAGWLKTIPSKCYQNAAGVPASMVLGDAAKESGETINASAATASLGSFFVRTAGPASRVLRQVSGGLWWMDATGTTQLGPRLGDPIGSPFTVISFSGAQGLFHIATETLSDWMPGRTFTSPTVTMPQTISLVTHELTNDGLHRLHVLATP